jgi:hypothetical protein
MKPLPQPLILAAAAAVLAGTASGCIVEGHYVRDAPPVAYAPPPPPAAQAPSQSPAAPPSQDPNAQPSDSTQAEPGPGVNVSEDYFYDRLSPYGYWRWTPEYGRVWVPAGVSDDWRPYYDGSWAYTDWGWTFASTVPWGWATYHYGRWGFGLGLGWYWIPGPVWGPAWVSWRYSAGWVAWAPLGPAGFYWGVHSPAWVAVGTAHFTQPIRTVAVTGARATPIVAATAPLRTVAPRPIAGARAINGPPVASISRAVGHNIRPAPVSRVLPSSRPAGRTVSGLSGSRMTAPRTSGAIRDRSYRPGDRWSSATGGSRMNSAVRPSGRWGAPGGRWGGGWRGPPSGGMSRPGGSSGSHSTAPSHSGGGHSGGGHSGGGHSSGGHGGGHH